MPFSMRPLLCAAGAAAMTGVYYYYDSRCVPETIVEPAITTLIGDAVLMATSWMSPAFTSALYGVIVRGTGSSAPKALAAEVVEKYDQVIKINAQLEEEISELKYHAHKLRNMVQQLEEMLYETDITHGAMKQDFEQAREAYSILNSKYEEVLKQHEESRMKFHPGCLANVRK